MCFETADICVSPWLPPLVAFAISFLTAMGGVSGAFLLLPFQMSVLGYTAPSVSATNQLFNVLAIPSGVYRYVREGRMVWPLAATVVAGSLPGVLIGAVVRVKYLPDPIRFQLFAAVVLLYVGGRMARDLIRERAEPRGCRAGKGGASDSRQPPGHTTRVIAANRSFIAYEFEDDVHRVPTAGIFLLCLVVGVVGGIYGIGGGAIVAPFLVTFFRLPVYTIAGAALMGTFVTSVVGVVFYQAISGWWPAMSIAPDWKLGALFGIGGAAGVYLGARCQKRVSARLIKWMLAAIIVLTAGRYVFAFVQAVVLRGFGD